MPAKKASPSLVRIGIAGTGFIAAGLFGLMVSMDGFAASRVLTRRPRGTTISCIDNNLLTRSVDDLVEHSDLIVECSGDAVHAAEVVNAALQAGRKVVTMNSEFHVTVGSYFCEKGMLTEAEGDQPGSIAALAEESMEMGFQPLVYGNIKGFLNHDPTREEMHYWSQRNGISLPQVTSFTDGTKLQIEQALVANGMGATIACRGLTGPVDQPLDVTSGILAREAKRLGSPLSDYALNRELPPGVFLVAEHPTERPDVLRYLKLGEGPFYTLVKPYHLCHLEMMKTIRRVARGGDSLLNNSTVPTVNVAAVAKRDMSAGTSIPQAAGGFQVRGEAVSFTEAPHAVPIGLLRHARLVRSVERGQTLEWGDVEIPESLAFTAALHIRDQVLGRIEVLRSAEAAVA